MRGGSGRRWHLEFIVADVPVRVVCHLERRPSHDDGTGRSTPPFWSATNPSSEVVIPAITLVIHPSHAVTKAGLEVSYHSLVDTHTPTRPARSPARTRPGRHRRHERPEPPHHARHSEDTTAPLTTDSTEESVPELEGGGGSSGRGRRDDDGGRRPDRDGDDARRLLIALSLIVVGAGVMGARLLAKGGRVPRAS